MVKEYESYFNNHNTAGAMSLVTDGIAIQESPIEMTFQGRQQIQMAHDFYFGFNTEIHFSACQNSANPLIGGMGGIKKTNRSKNGWSFGGRGGARTPDLMCVIHAL